jgi:hypothetical protein
MEPNAHRLSSPISLLKSLRNGPLDNLPARTQHHDWNSIKLNNDSDQSINIIQEINECYDANRNH